MVYLPYKKKRKIVLIEHQLGFRKGYVIISNAASTVFRIVFENMRKKYPKVFRNQVIGFDSKKNAYTTTPIFQETKAKPGRKFEVGKIRFPQHMCNSLTLGTFFSGLLLQPGISG